MSQRIVLNAKDGKLNIQELYTFVETAAKYGIKSDFANWQVSGKELQIIADLPKDVRVVGNRTVVLKRKNKQGRLVDKQISEHREKKVRGEYEYVPPVGRSGPAKPHKQKCPECNVRKPVVNMGGKKVIKPHVVHGVACVGSGVPA